MSLNTTHNEWTDGDITLELELNIVVNYKEIREKLYYDVFLATDTDGTYDIKRLLSDEQRLWIEKNIIDAMEEMECQKK